jgi:hypothetical protein
MAKRLKVKADEKRRRVKAAQALLESSPKWLHIPAYTKQLKKNMGITCTSFELEVLVRLSKGELLLYDQKIDKYFWATYQSKPVPGFNVDTMTPAVSTDDIQNLSEYHLAWWNVKGSKEYMIISISRAGCNFMCGYRLAAEDRLTRDEHDIVKAIGQYWTGVHHLSPGLGSYSHRLKVCEDLKRRKILKRRKWGDGRYRYQVVSAWR